MTVAIVVVVIFAVTYGAGWLISRQYRAQRLPRWQDERQAYPLDPVEQMDPRLPMAAQVDDGRVERFPKGSVTVASDRDGLKVIASAEDRVTPSTEKARRGILGLIR